MKTDVAKALIQFLTRNGGVQLGAGEIPAFTHCLNELNKIVEENADEPEAQDEDVPSSDF